MKASKHHWFSFLILRQLIFLSPITFAVFSSSLRKGKNENPRKDLTSELFSVSMNSYRVSTTTSQEQTGKYGRDIIEDAFLEPHDYKNEKLNHFARKWEASALHELKNHDRFGISHKVDYGNSHPFEFLARNRQLANKNSFQFKGEDDRSLQMMPWKQDEVYKPMRISLDTRHLDLISNKYAEKSAFLKTTILPRVIEFWTSALRVFPVAGNLKVDGEYCPFSDISQRRDGVPDTDLLIFVAANVKALCDNSPLAAARSCQADQFDRPTAGTVVVCLDKLDVDDKNIAETYVTILIHEFAHILGMRALDFAYYYDANTGLPRTSRPFKSQRTTCVDGVVSDIIVPSDDTMRQGRTAKGSIYYEIVTPAVRTVTRNQFNCQSMAGARLENQPTNSGNCFGSHWEARLFASEILSAITTQTKQVLSPLSLALFEDSGWYKPDYSVAEISSFGHGRGCNFVYDDCIDENGNVPEWGEGFFCNESFGPDSKFQCDGSRRNIARCDLVDFSHFPQSVPPDTNYQYFKDNPTWGGLLHTAAYCPMPSMVVTGSSANGIFEFSCSNKDLNSNEKYEYFGEDSRCYETNLSRPICMKTFCNAVTNRVNIIIDNKEVVVCEKDGDWMEIPGRFGNSVFQCPPIATVCPDLICPQNCAGRGVCDFTKSNPTCTCCNQADKSQTCKDSPIGCEYDFDDRKTFSPSSSLVNKSYPTNQPTMKHDHYYIDKEIHVQTPTFSKSARPVPFSSSFPTPTPSRTLRPEISDSMIQMPMKTPVTQYPSPLSMYNNEILTSNHQTPTTKPIALKRPSYYNPSSDINMPIPKPTKNISFIKPIVDTSNLSGGNISNRNESRIPSNQPSILPRDTTDIIYTFCLEHGALVPISEVLVETEKSINSVLSSFFNDDVQVMENKWNIDETHLRVQGVKSVWLKVPPPRFECACSTGDDIPSCSSVRSIVRVSYWDQLDQDKVRYLLVYFAPYLSGSLTFKAKYWGFQAVTTTSNFIMEGIPTTDMTEESKKKFEETIKNIFNEKVDGLNVEGLNILSVEVKRIVRFLPRKLLSQELNHLGETKFYNVSLITSGEYIPPPVVDFQEIITYLIESNGLEIVEKLKESGDPFFKDLKGIGKNVPLAPTIAPTVSATLDKMAPKQKTTGENKDIGMLSLIIIISILAAVAIAVPGFIYLKRHGTMKFLNQENFESQKYIHEGETLECDGTPTSSIDRPSGRFQKYAQLLDSTIHQISDKLSLTFSKHSNECSFPGPEPFAETAVRKNSNGTESISLHSNGEDSYSSEESQDHSFNSYSSRNSYSNDTITYVTVPGNTSSSSTRYSGVHQSSLYDGTNDGSKYSYSPPSQNRMDESYRLGSPTEINDDDYDSSVTSNYSDGTSIESVSESKMESGLDGNPYFTAMSEVESLDPSCETLLHSIIEGDFFDTNMYMTSNDTTNISSRKPDDTENYANGDVRRITKN